MSLASLIANHIDDILMVGTALAGAIWHRGKKLELKDLAATAEKLGRQILPKLLKDANLYDDAYVRAKLNAAIWDGLERLKIKRSKALDRLVDLAVEHLHAELAERLWSMHFDRIAGTLEQTNETLKSSL